MFAPLREQLFEIPLRNPLSPPTIRPSTLNHVAFALHHRSPLRSLSRPCSHLFPHACGITSNRCLPRPACVQLIPHRRQAGFQRFLATRYAKRSRNRFHSVLSNLFPVMLVALAITSVWIRSKMTINRFITLINRESVSTSCLLALPLKSLSRVIERFYPLSRTSNRPSRTSIRWTRRTDHPTILSSHRHRSGDLHLTLHRCQRRQTRFHSSYGRPGKPDFDHSPLFPSQMTTSQ